MSVEPRPAASLILLRRGGKHRERGIEILLVRRSTEASFMPGVWVFPGGGVDAGDGNGDEAAHRAAAVRELHEEAGIELAPDAELLAWSRWITPAHSPPRPDGEETTEAAWIAPGEALERHRAGELELVFPTIKHLEALLPFSSSDEVLAAARDRVVEPVLPRVVGEGREQRVVLPGEPGY
jgi:hypothetical protein